MVVGMCCHAQNVNCLSPDFKAPCRVCVYIPPVTSTSCEDCPDIGGMYLCEIDKDEDGDYLDTYTARIDKCGIDKLRVKFIAGEHVRVDLMDDSGASFHATYISDVYIDGVPCESLSCEPCGFWFGSTSICVFPECVFVSSSPRCGCGITTCEDCAELECEYSYESPNPCCDSPRPDPLFVTVIKNGTPLYEDEPISLTSETELTFNYSDADLAGLGSAEIICVAGNDGTPLFSHPGAGIDTADVLTIESCDPFLATLTFEDGGDTYEVEIME